MPKEYKIVIADTTCFILLDKIGELNLLQNLFGQVYTTTIVAAEFGQRLPSWIVIEKVKDIQFQSLLDVDEGEASAIESKKPLLLILDDNKGRKAARKLNLQVTGTFGILLKAKSSGIIPAIRPLIDKIRQTNFRYSEDVLQEVIALAGEK